jgi:undecaprenol kinase
MTKDHSQRARLGFALKGLRSAWRNEASFRTEVFVALPVFGVMAYAGVGPLWWLAAGLTTAMVLSAELINTALESICDALHPEHHPLIGIAKDCASAAVFICNLAAFAFLGALLRHIGKLW